MYPYNLFNYDEEIESEDLDAQAPPFQAPFFPAPPPSHTRPPQPPFSGHPNNLVRPGNEKPMGEPPSYVPRREPALFAVDPGAIKRCTGDFTYVWLTNGREFWMFPTFVGRTSIAGYRWTRHGWTYVGLDLSLIESFTCR